MTVLGAVQPSLTVLDHTARIAWKVAIRSFSYQMAVTTQSFGAAFCRLAGAGLALAAVLAVMEPIGMVPRAQAGSDIAIATGSVSGLPVPRFVSLKSDRVNVRAGPTKDQEVRWVYTRAGMPVEVTAEFENWRRIRDWEGQEGWVYHSLLSGKRTAVVAQLQAGVQGALQACTGQWCEFRGKGFAGWIRQDRLWGAYPNEKVE